MYKLFVSKSQVWMPFYIGITKINCCYPETIAIRYLNTGSHLPHGIHAFSQKDIVIALKAGYTFIRTHSPFIPNSFQETAKSLATPPFSVRQQASLDIGATPKWTKWLVLASSVIL